MSYYPVTGGVIQGQLVCKVDVLGGFSSIVADEGMTRLACSTALKGSLSGVPALGMPCPLCRPLVMTPAPNLSPSTASGITLSPFCAPRTKKRIEGVVCRLAKLSPAVPLFSPKVPSCGVLSILD